MTKKILLNAVFLALILSGCITAEKVTQPRVDQDVSGNEGYVAGKASKESKKAKAFDERSYIKVEIEVPPFPEMREKYWEDDEIWGNQGYLVGGPEKR